MKNISLFKRDNSDSYFIQYTNEDGVRKQISTRCSLKADALKFLSDLKTKQKTPKLKSKSVSDFTAEFILYTQTQFLPETVKIYKFALSLFQGSVGNIPMSMITPRHVDRWKSEVLLKPSRRGGKLSSVYLNDQFLERAGINI